MNIKFLMIFIIASVFIIAFSLGKSVIDKNQNKKKIDEFQKEIELLEFQKQEKIQQKKYFNSPQYKEKWNKQYNNLKRPNEKVIIIQDKKVNKNIEDEQKITKMDYINMQPNRIKWYIFFFE